MKARFINSCFVVIGLCLFALTGMAGIVNDYSPILKNSHQPGQVVIVTGGNIYSVNANILGGTGFVDRNVRSMVRARIDHDNRSVIPSYEDLRIGVDVTITDASGNSQTLPTNYLNLDYQPTIIANNYRDVSTLYYPGSVTISAVIVTITDKNGNQINLPDNVIIDAGVEGERFYSFVAKSQSQYSSISITPTDIDADGKTDVYKVSWLNSNHFSDEEYDLEWTFVDDYGATGNQLPSSALSYNFLKNSTRVTVKATSYDITNLFERGYLVARIRSRGRSINDLNRVLYSEWSEDQSGIVSNANCKVSTTGHEHVMPWDVKSVYAEEGRHKDVVTYYDGTNRARQSVTQNNEERIAIVAQTLYDVAGRKAVTVLPAPVQRINGTGQLQPSGIRFYPFMSKTSATDEFEKFDFDLDVDDACNGIYAKSVSSDAGAGLYYSVDNPYQSGIQRNVPDGQGYPFIQTEYTRDNTGRIRRQGGAGPDFQLGNNHETKYIYGQPNQIQLDRLFGSEAGDASHYKKNVIIDPNGQASVTYVDAAGKTVATSLAGDAPLDESGEEILISLPTASSAQKDFIADLFNKDANGQSQMNVVNSDGDALVFSSVVTIPSRTLYDINYTLELTKFNDECLPDNFCFHCLYDLEISVIDECGSPVVVVGAPQPVNPVVQMMVGVLNNGAPTEEENSGYFSLYCTPQDQTLVNSHLTFDLQPGSYTISKTLRVNKEARDFYLSKYLDKTINTCFTPESDAAALEAGLSPETNCNPDCQSCIDELGTKDDFVSSGKGSEELYDELVKSCMEPCEDKTWCDIAYEQMLADVSPYGQYGKVLDANGNFDPTANIISVYNGWNQLPYNIYYNSWSPAFGFLGWMSHYFIVPKNTAHWRAPLYIKEDGSVVNHYFDEDGNIFRIDVAVNHDGTFTPPVNGTGCVYYDVSTGKLYTYPECLANVSDFVDRFESSWAKSLVSYHPEYSYYKQCIQYADKRTIDGAELPMTSDEFDRKLINCNDFAEALSEGYIVLPQSGPYVVDDFTDNVTVSDPFFADDISGVNPYDVIAGSNKVYDVKNAMLDRLNNFIPGKSMMKVAAIMTRCGTAYGGADNCADFGTTATPDIHTKEWNTFRDLYISAKQKIQFDRANANAKYVNGYWNGCIGEDGRGFWYKNRMHVDILPADPAWGYPVQKPQYSRTFDNNHYKKNIKRFNSPQLADESIQNQTDYQMYLQTGLCPIALDLQQILTDITSRTQLETPQVSALSLSTVNGWTGRFYEFLNGQTGTGVTDQFVYYSLSNGNILDCYIEVPGSSSNTTMLHFTINKSLVNSGATAWSSIISISGLSIGIFNNGNAPFTAKAGVQNGSAMEFYDISGSINQDLNSCQNDFDLVCVPNDFAKSIENIIGVFSNDPTLLGNTTGLEMISPVPQAPPTPNDNPFYSLINGNIYTLFGLTSVPANFTWQYKATVPGTSLPGFYLYPSVPGGSAVKRIEILITQIEGGISFPPASPLDIAYVDNVKPGQPSDLFSFETFNSLGVKTGTIHCAIRYVDNGTVTSVSMGVCDLPLPLQCNEDPILLLRDMQNLLTERLPGMDENVKDNLFASLKMTDLLSDYISPNATSSVVSVSDIQTNNVHRVQWQFQFHPSHDCNMKLWIEYPISMYSGVIDMTMLTAVGDFVEYGQAALNGSYGFRSNCTFTVNGVNRQILLYGETCFPLKNCTPCLNTNLDPIVNQQRLNNQQNLIEGNRRLMMNSSAQKSVGVDKNATQDLQCLKLYNRYVGEKILKGDKYDNSLSREVLSCEVLNSLAEKEKETNSALNHGSRNGELPGITTGSTVNCEELYLTYTTIMDQFNAAFWETYGVVQVFSLEEIQLMGLCDCLQDYLLYIQTYLNNSPGSPLLPPPLSLEDFWGCSNDPCMQKYKEYWFAMYAYNHSAYATGTGNFLVTEPLSTFINDPERCNCLTAYIQYLLPYISVYNSGSSVPVPTGVREFSDCEITTDCDQLTVTYQSFIDIYNQSDFAAANGTLQLEDPQVIHDEYCECIASYLNYLMPYLVNGASSTLLPPVSIINWWGCNDNLECNEHYDKYVSMMSAYITSDFYIATGINWPLIGDSDFLDYCECAAEYLQYMNSYLLWENGMPHYPEPVDLVHFWGCSDNECDILYQQYWTAVTAFNQSAYASDCHCYIEPLSWDVIHESELCECLDNYIIYLSGFINAPYIVGSVRPVGITEFDCNEDQPCNRQYAIYQALIDAYNAPSKYLQATGNPLQFIPYSEDYCECLDRYILYLFNYVYNYPSNLMLQPPQNINVWDGCNGGEPCEKFADYSNAINAFNSSYYSLSHNNVQLTALTSNALVAGGYCNCITAYLDYLDGYINGAPQNYAMLPPVSIDQFNACNGDEPCFVNYMEYVGAITTFNASVYSTNHNYDLTVYPFGYFIQNNLCGCINAFQDYLSGYTSWSATNPDRPLPMNIQQFCDLQNTGVPVEELTECQLYYYHYLGAVAIYNYWAHNSGNPLVNPIVSATQFEQYCSCYTAYLQFLFSTIQGVFNDPDFLAEHINIADFCAPYNPPPPCIPSPLDISMMDPVWEQDDPCEEQSVNIEATNLALFYQQEINLMTTQFVERYNAFCLKAVESLTGSYKDKEYHFTLYYYDQAGNLVKTVPPEGVEMLPIQSFQDPVAIEVRNARGENKSYPTSHRMATVYTYNSLNQLIRQDMPDHDKMNLVDFALPEYLEPEFVSTGMHFVNSSLGYLTGYVQSSGTFTGDERGLLYRTIDGGKTWRKISKVIATEYNKIFFIKDASGNPTAEGIAAGNNGFLFTTTSGGGEWDFNALLLKNNITDDITDLWFTDLNNGVMVTRNGKIYKVNNGTVLNPVNNSTLSFTSLSYDGSNYIATGKTTSGDGVIYYSSNGSSWNPITDISLNENILCIWMKNSSEGYAGGRNGLLLHNTNGVWKVISTSTRGVFRKVYFSNNDCGVAILENNPGIHELYKTTDGGHTWTLLGNALERFYDFTFASNSKGFACGSNVLVRITFNGTNYGAVHLNTPSSGIHLKSVHAVEVLPASASNPVYALAVVSGNTVYFTRNASGNSISWSSKAVANLIYLDDVVFNWKASTGNEFCFLASGVNIIGSNGVVSVIESAGVFTETLISCPGCVIPELDEKNGTAYIYETSSDNIYSLNIVTPPAAVTLVTGTMPAVTRSFNRFTANGIDNNFAVAGNNGVIAVSTNYNTTAPVWTDHSHNIKPLGINDADLSLNGEWYAIGNNGFVLTSTTPASAWQLKTTGISEDYTALSFNNGYDALVGTRQGSVIKGSSSLPSFISVQWTPSQHAVNDVVYDWINQRGWVAGDNGELRYVDFINNTAKPANQPTTTNLNAIAWNNTGKLIIGGSQQLFEVSGYNLSEIKSVYPPVLNDVSFADNLDGYVAGRYSLGFHTTDGGDHWSVILSSPFNINQEISTVCALEPGLALTGGNGNYIGIFQQNTSAALATHTYNNSSAIQWNDIQYHKRSGTATVVGSVNGTTVHAARIVKSVINANPVFTETAINFTGNGGLLSSHIFNDGSVISCGENGTIRFLKNGTTAWNSFNVNINSTEEVNDVFFHDDRNGYAICESGAIYKIKLDENIQTLSAAAPWTQVSWIDPLTTNAYSQPLRHIYFKDRKSGIMTGSQAYTGTGIYPMARLIHDESDLYSTRFYYDKVGRLVVSQNTKQFNGSGSMAGHVGFVYTLYDQLGRIVETGQKYDNSTGTFFNGIFGSYVGAVYNTDVIDADKMIAWINGDGDRREVVHTYYDSQTQTDLVSSTTFEVLLSTELVQENLRNRVASVTYEEIFDNDPLTFANASHYSYDIHGNVKTLLQDNNNLPSGTEQNRLKRMDYDYDLISSKVNTVAYQRGKTDQFYHSYIYDAENNLTEVKTSRDDILLAGIDWNADKDARYEYYLHGPLGRMELGDLEVQGVDYAYTIQGWLKGVNSNTLDTEVDMGNDGHTAGLHQDFARDAFGFTIGYYKEDYKAINNDWNNAPEKRFEALLNPSGGPSSLEQEGHYLYNGNIKHTAMTIVEPTTFDNSGQVIDTKPIPLGTGYKYDQLSRIKTSVSYKQLDFDRSSATFNQWMQADPNKSFVTTYDYDANGNIKLLTRQDGKNFPMDNLEYGYLSNSTGKTIQNRLYNAHEVSPGLSLQLGDYEESDPFNNPSDPSQVNITNIFSYDEIGNLKKDLSEDIDVIDWTVSGKIKSITRSSGSTKPDLTFEYDAMGNRIAKKVWQSGNLLSATYYLRDHSGNEMATYQLNMDPSIGQQFHLSEQPMFGSSRLGVSNLNIEVQNQPLDATLTNGSLKERLLATKNYELTNHLGNVQAIITDRKICVNQPGAFYSYFIPDITLTYDYYPFGMNIQERTLRRVYYKGANFANDPNDVFMGVAGLSTDPNLIDSEFEGYRFGFNGMEKDDNGFSPGNHYTTLHRQFDPRLARWWSVDPESQEYPDESPYVSMENNPISESDPDGDCPWCVAFVKGAVQEYATQVITNIAQGKSLGESFTDVDGGEILKSAVIDGLTLGLGSVVKKTTTVVKIANAADKANDTRKTVQKVNKVASTTDKVSKVEKNVVKAVNKNNNTYVGKQSVYEIKIDGKLEKYGKADATNLSKTTGQPRRLQTQLDKMQKDNPGSKVEGKVLETHDNISTKDIKKIETKYVQDHTNKTGSLPPGNQRHPGVKVPNKTQ